MRSKYFLLSFLVPLVVRAIPEIISYPWPIGYDTVNSYAPFIYDCQIYGFFTVLFNYGFFTELSSFLVFVLVGGLGALVGVDPFLVLKMVTPVLGGFLGLSIFYFLTEYLGWSYKRGVICAILCVVYFVALRITWDLLRNTLGLVFFFLAVSQTKNLGERKRVFLFISFSFLCLFTHELMSVVLFVVIAYLLLLELFSFRVSDLLNRVKPYLESKAKFLRRSDEATDSELPEDESRKVGESKKVNRTERSRKYAWYQKLFKTELRPRVLAVYIFVAICTLIIMLYHAGYFRVDISIDLLSQVQPSFFIDYISWGFGAHQYLSVDALRGNIFTLFFIAFAPILLFAVLGFFRNDSLDIMTLFLLAAPFMPVVSPHFALLLWNRWMLMLVFPFVIYASNFLLPDNQVPPLIRRLKISKKTRRVVFVIVVPALFLLSAAYMVIPSENAFTYFTEFNTQAYLPSTMQYNTLPLYQNPYAVLACEWLKWNMPPDSCLVVHRSLYGWAKLNLPFRPAIIYFRPFITYDFHTNSFIDIGLAETLFKTRGYNSTYVLTLPPSNQLPSGDFELVLRSGLIEIYRSID